jgi:stress response protein SCP2
MPITLTKADGAADLTGITDLAVGLSWDATGGSSGGVMGKLKRKVGVDLDAFGILMAGADPLRYVGLDVTDAMDDGSVTHSGDNQTGKGSGDDELISMKLDKIPPHIDRIVFVVAAYKRNSDFDKAAKISVKVYDNTGSTQTQVADIWPSLIGTGNALAIARADRTTTGWTLSVLSERGQVAQGDIKSLLRWAANQ